METHIPIKSPRSRGNQIRRKTREAKLMIPSKRPANTKAGKETSRNNSIGNRILAILNYIAQTKDLLWYFILILTIYVKRTYGFPVIHQAIMPLGTNPIAWITSPDVLSRNHSPGIYGPHDSIPAITPSTGTPDTSPEHSGSTAAFPDFSGPSMKFQTYFTILIAAGFLITLVAGIAALFRRLLRHNPPPPHQPSYEHQEEEDHSQSEDEEEEINVRKIMRKAAHLRSPMERLIIINWSKQQNPLPPSNRIHCR